MNLAARLLATAESEPDRPALVGPEALTYGELAARSAAVAAAVAAVAASDDRVAVVAGNEAAFVVAYLGVLAAGAVAVPLNVDHLRRSSHVSSTPSNPCSCSRPRRMPTSPAAPSVTGRWARSPWR